MKYVQLARLTVVSVSEGPLSNCGYDQIQVPDEPLVEVGWTYIGGAFIPPVVIPPSVSPPEFKLLFTSNERVAIKAARSTDPVIADFMDIVEDPRLTTVNLAL